MCVSSVKKPHEHFTVLLSCFPDPALAELGSTAGSSRIEWPTINQLMAGGRRCLHLLAKHCLVLSQSNALSQHHVNSYASHLSVLVWLWSLCCDLFAPIWHNQRALCWSFNMVHALMAFICK